MSESESAISSLPWRTSVLLGQRKSVRTVHTCDDVPGQATIEFAMASTCSGYISRVCSPGEKEAAYVGDDHEDVGSLTVQT